jgi:hypothetical protein
MQDGIIQYGTGPDDILGTGKYGYVFKGKLFGENVAVKRVHLADIVVDNREMSAFRNLDHDNVLQLLHVENEERYM